jgi:hypothetical protein
VGKNIKPASEKHYCYRGFHTTIMGKMQYMKTKILFSGLGGSLFPYLHDRLKGQYDLFYVDNNEYLSYVYPNFNFYKAPVVTDKSYYSLIRKIIDENKIDYYIPLIDEEIIEAKQLEDYNGIQVITPSVSFCALSMNKFLLMNMLEKEKISCIE